MNALTRPLDGVSVLAMPTLDISRDRVTLTLTPGLTVAEMVERVFPDLQPGRLEMVEVKIAGHKVFQSKWSRVRPKAGMQVVIRMVPRGGTFRSILAVVITVAAIALGQFYVGPLLAGALGVSAATAGAVATAALGFAGNLLLNALVPIKKPNQESESPTYSVEGWKNAANRGGPVADVLGVHRIAPSPLASPFTETIGDDRWITGVFGLYGPVTISDIQIGETKLTDLKDDEYEIEIRYGYPDDEPLSLYPNQISEYQVGISLEARDEDDEFAPITRKTPPDAEELSIDIAFPGGLIDVDNEGEEEEQTVSVKVEYRLVGDETWTLLDEFIIAGKTRRPIFRGFRWTPPTRARYECRLTRTSGEDSTASQETVWAAVRAHRPEYPLNFPYPLAMVCAKIKATKLTNGTLDDLNFVAGRVCKDWDSGTGTWIVRETKNPASAYRWAKQGPVNGKPLGDDELDLVQLAEWHEFCTLHGLEYNRVHDYDATLEEALFDICRAGRATPQNFGTRWGVCIDRQPTEYVQMVSARNSWDMKGSVVSADPPDAWRIPFRDASYQWEAHERIVPRPGLVGAPQRIEELNADGITDPDQIWYYGRRRFLELEYRSETWQATQDVENLIVVRGNGVKYAPFESQIAARVKAVSGRYVELDESVNIKAGTDYGIRFRLSDGASVLWAVSADQGEYQSVRVTSIVSQQAGQISRAADDDWLPEVNDLAVFGLLNGETVDAIVKDVENGQDYSAIITMMPAAPEIDAFLAADTPPAWDGRVGEEVEIDVVAPAYPRILSVITGEAARAPDTVGYPPVVVYLAARGATRVTAYEVQHRLSGAGTWSGPVSALSIIGRVEVAGYVKDDVVELQARSVGQTGLTSAWSATTTVTVGAEDPEAMLPVSDLSVTGDDDTATVSWRNPNDSRVDGARVYRTSLGAEPIIDDLIATSYGGPSFEPPSVVDAAGYGDWTYHVFAFGGGVTSEAVTDDITLVAP